MSDIKNHVVSLELAKKLKELCLIQESIFCWARVANEHNHRLFYNYERYQDHYIEQDTSYSAFLASELGECLPAEMGNPHLEIFKQREGTWGADYICVDWCLVGWLRMPDCLATLLIKLIEADALSKEWRAIWLTQEK